MALKLPKPDPYIVGILCSVALAVLLPVHGSWVATYSLITKLAVALLFFLYGVRLPREVVFAGLIRWRLHLLVFSITFGLYPLISLIFPHLPGWLLAPSLAPGMVYLCCMPSTIQSNVALVSSAKGDVAAAVCSASASSMLGVVLSPVLVGLLMRTQGIGISVNAIEGIFLQLLLPFAVGQVVHPWLGKYTERYKKLLTPYDRLTIFMIVYGAFSAAMVGGVWKQVTLVQLLLMACLCAALLAVVMNIGVRLARAFGFPVTDEIVVAFCGTQKGMAAGVPMASLLFPAAQVGIMVLPLMIFHQFQLITCAVVASRYAKRAEIANKPA
jgi:sodium/bile acid cotransporter 7